MNIFRSRERQLDLEDDEREWEEAYGELSAEERQRIEDDKLERELRRRACYDSF